MDNQTEVRVEVIEGDPALPINHEDNVILKDEQVHRWSLDPDIRQNVDGTTANEEPLLVNLVDSWKLRPEAVTRIPNLFLASDYASWITGQILPVTGSPLA